MTEPQPLAIGIVGFGKIARDQHVPAIRDSASFRLHSVADPAADAGSIRRYPDLDSLLAANDAPDAIAVCTPPQARYAIARLALTRAKHVLLEKPPGATVSEVDNLRRLAESSGRTLFCAWHSRFAPAVAPAREWLAARRLRRVRIDWREDVRVWHPNQEWIWQPGGFGVFDPGINALSVALEILPQPPFLREAVLRLPSDCATPISAELSLSDARDTKITASFDFLPPGPPAWTIEIETDDGHLLLADGGSRLTLDGTEIPLGPNREYPALYAHFGQLVAANRSDADVGPLSIVADAFMRGRQRAAAPFHKTGI